jgi:hypothetical protein
MPARLEEQRDGGQLQRHAEGDRHRNRVAALATTQRHVRAGAGLELGSADLLRLDVSAPQPSA